MTIFTYFYLEGELVENCTGAICVPRIGEKFYIFDSYALVADVFHDFVPETHTQNIEVYLVWS